MSIAFAVIATVKTVSITALIAVPVSAVLSAATTLLITRANEATNRRRDRYSYAVETLVAWIEFPYRVRRRANDNPATLTALANRGHDIQERLACHQVWIATDHPNLANTYAETRATLDQTVGPAITSAWESSPVTQATEMNLSGWGPDAVCREKITDLQHEIEKRFGLRRFRRQGNPRT